MSSASQQRPTVQSQHVHATCIKELFTLGVDPHAVWTSLRITVLVLFRYASPCLCNQLPASVRQRATSLYLCLSLLFYTCHLVVFVSTLLPPTTPSLFRFRLKITPYTDLVYHRLSSYLCIDSTDFYHYRFLLSLSVFAFFSFSTIFSVFVFLC